MNRPLQRLVGSDAKQIAKAMACATRFATPSGHLVLAKDVSALAALEQAFEAMLLIGEPIAREIGRSAGLAFPQASGVMVPGDCRPWLAVGIDVSGAPTCCLRWVHGVALSTQPGRILVRNAILRELSLLIGKPGLAPWGDPTCA